MKHLVQRFKQTEQQREQVLKYVDEMDEEELQRRPGEGQWSMAHLLHHIITAEAQTLQHVKYKISQKENLKKSGFVSWFKSVVLTIALKLPLKYKIPPVLANIPERPDVEELKSEWQKLRDEWYKLLNDFPAELAGKQIFKHPVIGRINISQTVEFMTNHLNHHIPQAERLRKVKTTAAAQ